MRASLSDIGNGVGEFPPAWTSRRVLLLNDAIAERSYLFRIRAPDFRRDSFRTGYDRVLMTEQKMEELAEAAVRGRYDGLSVAEVCPLEGHDNVWSIVFRGPGRRPKVHVDVETDRTDAMVVARIKRELALVG